MVRAAILRMPADKFAIEPITLRPIADHEVRVRLAATGVCRSDRSVQRGSIPQPFPVVLGHEGSGVVVEVGAAVVEPQVGDHVVLSWVDACRACFQCATGHVELCEHGIDHAFAGPYALDQRAEELWPGFGTATFAEETVVPATCAIGVDRRLPLDIAALLGCAVVTGAGAVRNSARVGRGESVAIVGAGGVGLSAIQAAVHAGADPVIAIDRLPAKLELATACGATHVFSSDDAVAEQVRAVTDSRGVDHAFEVVGLPATIELAYEITRRGGTITVVGAGNFDDNVRFGAMQLMVDAKTIRGCVYGATDPRRDIPALAAMHLAGEIDLSVLCSRHIELDELDEAMEWLDAGVVARSVVMFPDSGV